MMGEYRERLHGLIPGGAHTYSRGDDQFPTNAPALLERGEGCHVWDADGRKYLDYGMALRAVTVGYGHPAIADAAIAEIRKGNNLTRATHTELEAADTMVSLIDGADMVKFAKNGSSVTTAALKLARAYTHRSLVAVCAQHPFFSYDDWFIGSTVMKRGVPGDLRTQAVTFDFNDLESLRAVFTAHPDDVAAVILEPATSEEPAEGFLAAVKEMAHANGAVFVLDEMITGFRWNLSGAQRHYGVAADLSTFGKGMANGFSVAALVGRREIMELGSIREDAAERVFLMSTTHGAEMSGLGAFLATVQVYREEGVVEHLWSYGRRLCDGVNALARAAGVQEQFTMEGVPCSPAYVARDRTGEASLPLRTLFIQEMLESGVLMPWVALSASHGEAELDQTLVAAERALQIYAAALDRGVDQFLRGPAIKPVFRQFN